MKLKIEFDNYDSAKLFETYVANLIGSKRIITPQKVYSLEEEIY